MGGNLLVNYGEAVAMLLFGIGFANLLFQKNLIKKIIGFNIMDTAIYLFLAEKGYNLFKGKQGKAKIAILIVAIIFGVLLGNFAADAFSLATMIANGELPGMGLIDIPYMISVLLTSEPEYLRITISNILMGLLFAGLGVFSLLRKTGKEVSATKVIDLE